MSAKKLRVSSPEDLRMLIAGMRSANEKAEPWTRNLTDKVIRYPESVTNDEWVEYYAEVGKVRLLLKEQVIKLGSDDPKN